MPKLFLIPNFLSEIKPDLVFPEYNFKVIKNLRIFFVENLRSARRFLKKIDKSFPIDDTFFFVLNKDTKSEDLFEGFNFFIKNGDAGIISESGMPAIADPGSLLVSMAHENNIVVKPLIGPSSVFLALSASGLNGQNFRFLGYLTNKSHLLRKEIKSIERVSRERNETQIFIETPYRNVSLLENLIRFCNPDTLLTVATEITGENEVIKTMPIKDWRNADLKAFHKRNTIFLLLSK